MFDAAIPLFEAPSCTMSLVLCFLEWDCFGVQVAIFQILSCSALRAMTGPNGKVLLCLFFSLPKLSLRIKRQYINWLAGYRCLMRQSHYLKHYPEQCFLHCANKFGIAL